MWSYWRSVVPANQPTVLIVDATMLERIAELCSLPDDIIIVATDEASETALGRRADISLVGGPGLVAGGSCCARRVGCRSRA
jgi:hypothetical protein